jgi:streptogramin lyase
MTKERRYVIYELSTMIPRAAKTISTVGVGTRYCVTAGADYYRLYCSWAKTDSFDALKPGAGNRVAVLTKYPISPGTAPKSLQLGPVGAAWCVARAGSAWLETTWNAGSHSCGRAHYSFAYRVLC